MASVRPIVAIRIRIRSRIRNSNNSTNDGIQWASTGLKRILLRPAPAALNKIIRKHLFTYR